MNERVKKLLQGIVDDMVYPNGWINECKFCHVSWPDENSHEEDCIYLEAKAILNDEGRCE